MERLQRFSISRVFGGSALQARALWDSHHLQLPGLRFPFRALALPALIFYASLPAPFRSLSLPYFFLLPPPFSAAPLPPRLASPLSLRYPLFPPASLPVFPCLRCSLRLSLPPFAARSSLLSLPFPSLLEVAFQSDFETSEIEHAVEIAK